MNRIARHLDIELTPRLLLVYIVEAVALLALAYVLVVTFVVAFG